MSNPIVRFARLRCSHWLLLLYLALPLEAAEATKHQFNVPAGDAVETLKQVARQGGVEIMFPAPVVSGVRTPEVKGELSLADALGRLLVGTPLRVAQDEKSGALTVTRSEVYSENSNPSPPVSSPSSTSMSSSKISRWLTGLFAAAQLHAQVPPDPKSADETVSLSPFQVTSSNDQGYGSRSSMGATRVALPATDVSASVVVLNENFLRDVAATQSTEALQYVSGVQSGDINNSNRTYFSLRGYTSGINLRDGLPEALVSGGDIQRDDESQYSRIEVIKGPAGTLYGSTSLGGIVNIVSRWPSFIRKNFLQVQAQTNDRMLRSTFDSTGPLTPSTAYRVVISNSETERYFRKTAHTGIFSVTASLLHNFKSNGGKAWTSYRFLQSDVHGGGQGPQFITGYLDPKNPTVAPVVSDGNFAIAYDQSVASRNTANLDNYSAYEAGYEQSFEGLGGNWTLRLVGRYNYGRGDTNPSPSSGVPIPVDAQGKIVTYVNAAGVVTNGDNRFISAKDPRVADWRSTLSWRNFSGFGKNANIFVDLVGNIATGPVKQKVLFSTNLGDGTTERAFFFWNVLNPTNTSAVANSFSVVRPDPYLYTLTDGLIKSQSPTQFNTLAGNAEVYRFSQSVQDNIMLFGDRLIGTIGARYDNAHFTNKVFDSAKSLATGKFIDDPTRTTTSNNSEFTYKYGLVYKVQSHVGLFGQVSQTFVPISTLDRFGAKFPNQEGEMKEVGINTELFDGRLVATASVFNMELTNVLVSVVNPPELGGGTTQVPAGVQKTRGYELDLAAEPIRGLNMVLAFSDVTSKNTQGFYFRDVPVDPTWSLFANYRFQSGPLQRFNFGVGTKRWGKTAGDATNTWFRSAADNYDAFIGYTARRWSAQFNVFDVLNDHSIITAGGDTSAYRNFQRMRLTLRYEF